jgi:hypothetical protein
MNKLIPLFLLGITISSVSIGCGGNQPDPGEAVVVPPTENVRNWLSNVATSGQLDSGVTGIQSEIARMQEAGVPRAEELKRDAEELAVLRRPAQIRQKANEMLSKLPPEGASDSVVGGA